jgi:hypothetical protein
MIVELPRLLGPDEICRGHCRLSHMQKVLPSAANVLL